MSVKNKTRFFEHLCKLLQMGFSVTGNSASSIIDAVTELNQVENDVPVNSLVSESNKAEWVDSMERACTLVGPDVLAKINTWDLFHIVNMLNISPWNGLSTDVKWREYTIVYFCADLFKLETIKTVAQSYDMASRHLRECAGIPHRSNDYTAFVFVNDTKEKGFIDCPKIHNRDLCRQCCNRLHT